jgi:hypothetical protein
VQVFVWTTHLPQLLHGRSPDDRSASAGTAGPQTTPIGRDIASCLAGSAAAAGAEGEVDVQVGDQPGQRYQLQPGREPALAPSSTTPEAHILNQEGLSGLELHSVSPPCLSFSGNQVLPAAGRPAAIVFNLQLTSHQEQHVRVIVVAAATGTVLVDGEYGVTAGHLTTLQLELPSSALAAATTGKGRQDGGGLQPVTPLRLIITTPTDHTQGAQQYVRLLATATLLVAPASLASELCGLHELMQQEGQQEGLAAQEMWSHWQVLMNDLALCLLAADDLSSATPGPGTAPPAHQRAALAAAADSLCEFFTHHVMSDWQAQMQGAVQSLGHQQGENKPATCMEKGSVASPSHRDVPAGPAMPLEVKSGARSAAPAAGVNDSTQQPQKPATAGASSGKGAASRDAPDARHPEVETAPPVHRRGLLFKDKAQEQHYRDWAMRRARVPIRIW